MNRVFEIFDTSLRKYIDQRCDALDTSLRKHVSDECEKVETKLLTAFHNWASPVDTRLRSHTAVLRALDLEQEALADRIAKLERPDAA